MKKNRLIIFLILLVILLGGYFLAAHFWSKPQEEANNYEEYTPQEEISEEQYRETIVSLYFVKKDTKEIMEEVIAIDARTLANNPYKKLIELLLEGPKNENLERVIPEGTQVYDASIEAGCVVINVSKEILNFGEDETMKNNIINSIYKTLTELTEVNSIRFLIEGEENSQFAQEYKEII